MCKKLKRGKITIFWGMINKFDAINLKKKLKIYVNIFLEMDSFWNKVRIL